MKKLINKIKFWYNNSRPYTIPITLLSWFVIFIYSLLSGGNLKLGILCYFGVAIVHLATNLSDDYFDYKRLIKKNELNSSKACKCRYLKDNKASITELRNVILGMLFIAGCIGLYLFYASGWPVGIFALLGLIIALFYSKFSSNGFGDFAVIIAYGPLMYEGIYYVMTQKLSFEVLILSFACGIFVNTILYSHMLMDYDEDIASNKTTLCTKLGSKQNALVFLLIFYLLGYIFLIINSIINQQIIYILPLLTLPLVIDLYNSLKIYNKNSSYLPNVKFWNHPLENWETLKNTPNAPFFLRFLYCRNICTTFMLLTCISIIISKI